MPVNLLSLVVNWFATHLVVFSLLGFVFVGLLVFDLIQMPGAEPAAGTKTGQASVRPRTGAEAPASADWPAAAQMRPDMPEARPDEAGEGGADALPGTPERPGPRLIGGSLPVYGQPDASPATLGPGPVSSPAAGSFRPPGETAPSDAVGMTRDDYLQQARRAFWNGEFETAEAAYMALISEYPADADAFGELGNLYQSMGKSDRAMDAYFEAGKRLKAAGETEKLNEIIELFTNEGDERVQQLNP